jgi:excisionase family DNA binding protein
MSAVLERDPVAARDEEHSQLAKIEGLYERFDEGQPGMVRLVGPNDQQIDLPESVVRLLRQIVHVLAQGEAVSIVPVHKELTTQQAADLLNVSRQYLVTLLERGELPFHKTGTHRRIKFGDLMDYKRRRDEARKVNLDKLTRLGQELGDCR